MNAPAADPPLLDLDHLRRHTFGDPALEREVLTLFMEQCAKLTPLVTDSGAPERRTDAAHTLKGSARAVGARRLAHQTELIEAALRDGQNAVLPALLLTFADVVEATRRAVAARRAAALA